MRRGATRGSGPGGPRPRPAGHWRGSLALGAASGALSAYTLRRQTGPHDEGLMLAAASRLAAGQLPHRDFWANYPPGQALALAALQRTLGPSLLHWRLLRVGVDALTGVLAHRLAASEAPPADALMAWAGTAGAMAFPATPGPNPAAIALSFAALLAATEHPRTAGALAGATALFRIELGASAVAGVVARAPRGARAGAGRAALAVTVATLGPFAAAAPGAMASQTIGFLAIQHLQRLPLRLRYDGPRRPSKLIEFYMPPLLLGALGLWMACMARAGDRACPGAGGHQRAAVDLALGPTALVGAAYLAGRSDEFHLVPLAATLPVMLAVAAARSRGLERQALRGALLLISAHGFERRVGQARHRPELAPVPGRAGQGVLTSPADARALDGLLRAVQRLTRAREPIFVANPRHDLVRVGNPLLYTILDRPNASRYDVMQPGVVTTETVQREIVAALEAGPVRVVVRWLDPTACAPEPNGAGRSSGVEVLDRHLERHYQEIERFGHYALLLRREESTAGWEPSR